jgi:uncharacterized iron-regulated membrane protein
VACAACCAAPIIGFITAIGIGAMAGALFGLLGLAIAAIGAALWLKRRRQRIVCPPAPEGPVAVVVQRANRDNSFNAR